MVVVHHTRKQIADDFVDSVSGTNGLAGAADAILHLSRGRATHDAVLSITGRDVTEDKKPLRFTPQTCTWTLLEAVTVEEVEMSQERRDVLALIRQHGSLTPKQLSEIDGAGIEHENAKKLLPRMARDHQIDTDGRGMYFLNAGSGIGFPHPLSPATGG